MTFYSKYEDYHKAEQTYQMAKLKTTGLICNITEDQG